ncbi:MAG: smalltalk protein [Paraprevotella sp.]|nr:smalltalk protein [Paraprevotella sp.]
MDSKNKWSVFINAALTAITAILTAFGFNVG